VGDARRSSATGYRALFAIREFRALFTAHVLSSAGDQIARVAASVLVYARTGSAGLTALTVAVGFVPDVIAGPLLSGLADRFPPRRVMVLADVARAVLVGVIAVPGMPPAAIVTVLFVASLASTPFSAARYVVLPALVPDVRVLPLGMAALGSSYQICLTAGYPLGAALVTSLGAGAGLLVDMATFLASAALLARWVRARPGAGTQHRTTWSAIAAGGGVVVTDRRLRVLIGLGCTAGVYVGAEALLVPYTAQIHAGTSAVGWMGGALAMGSALGGLVLSRALSGPAQRRWLGPLAIATPAVLVPMVMLPGLGFSLLLWGMCGMLAGHDVITRTLFVAAAPAAQRAQVLGLAQAAIRGAQGFAVLGVGLGALAWTPAHVITAAALMGTAVAVGMALAWRRADTTAPGH
jgi:hypothetical protein